MNSGKTVFAQLFEHLPLKDFHRCVKRYQGETRTRSFSCLDQFFCMAFAQLTYRESLRDIEVCLRTMQSKLYHMGFRSRISKSTLAEANEKRDWRIYADFAQSLIRHARELYREEDLGIELNETVYALDSSTIDLCLSLFPWAKFRQQKGAIKLHTAIDLRGNIPTFVHITNGKIHDVNVLDVLDPEPNSIYLMDRGYLDFQRLYSLNQNKSFFVTRLKKNTKFQRIYSHPVDKTTGVRCDQTIHLTNPGSIADYPDFLRRVGYYDAEQDRRFDYLTNHFSLSPLTVANLYRCRWQVELFFKWIKQHLRIKSFYGTSENAVKTQVWIALSVYVLVAIIKKHFHLEPSLYTLLQVISVSLFEKRPLPDLFSDDLLPPSSEDFPLFDALDPSWHGELG